MKAVIFDIDDTLISERMFMESGYREISKAAADKLSDGWRSIYEKLLELSEESPKYIINRLFDSYGIRYDENDIGELIRIYREHEPELEFYSDVLPAIGLLKNKGIRTGIISDGYPVMQHNKLKACRGEQYFDKIIITNELGGSEYNKPDMRSYDIMAEALQVSCAEMLYVGDNPEKDFLISKSRPVKTARIIRPRGIYAGREYREGIRETYRIKDLKETAGQVHLK